MTEMDTAELAAKASPFWITRDSDVEGNVDAEVEVWRSRPWREEIIPAYYPSGAFWSTSDPDGDLIARLPAADVLRWLPTGASLPATDRECVRVG